MASTEVKSDNIISVNGLDFAYGMREYSKGASPYNITKLDSFTFPRAPKFVLCIMSPTGVIEKAPTGETSFTSKHRWDLECSAYSQLQQLDGFRNFYKRKSLHRWRRYVRRRYFDHRVSVLSHRALFLREPFASFDKRVVFKIASIKSLQLIKAPEAAKSYSWCSFIKNLDESLQLNRQRLTDKLLQLQGIVLTLAEELRRAVTDVPVESSPIAIPMRRQSLAELRSIEAAAKRSQEYKQRSLELLPEYKRFVFERMRAAMTDCVFESLRTFLSSCSGSIGLIEFQVAADGLDTPATSVVERISRLLEDATNIRAFLHQMASSLDVIVDDSEKCSAESKLIVDQVLNLFVSQYNNIPLHEFDLLRQVWADIIPECSTLETHLEAFSSFVNRLAKIRDTPRSVSSGMFVAQASGFIDQVEAHIEAEIDKEAAHICTMLHSAVTATSSEIDSVIQGLSRDSQRLSDYIALKAFTEKCQSYTIPAMGEKLQAYQSVVTTLGVNNFKVSAEDAYNISGALSRFHQINDRILPETQQRLTKAYEKVIQELCRDVQEYGIKFRELEDSVLHWETDPEGAQNFRDLANELETNARPELLSLHANYERIRSECQALQPALLEDLRAPGELDDSIDRMNEIGKIVTEFHDQETSLLSTPLAPVRILKFEQTAVRFREYAKSVPMLQPKLVELDDWIVAKLPLLRAVTDPLWRPQHWQTLTSNWEGSSVIDPSRITVNDLAEAGFFLKGESIQSILAEANTDHQNDLVVASIEQTWNDVRVPENIDTIETFLIEDILGRLRDDVLRLTTGKGKRVRDAFKYFAALVNLRFARDQIQNEDAAGELAELVKEIQSIGGTVLNWTQLCPTAEVVLERYIDNTSDQC